MNKFKASPRKIYRVVEVYNVPDDGNEEVVFLTDTYPGVAPGTTVMTVEGSEVTLDELAEAIDQTLEGANEHRWTGVGWKIATVAKKMFGEEQAKWLLWRMVEEHGFDWSE